MIFFIRKITKNVISCNLTKELNGFLVGNCYVAENENSLEDYFRNILMCIDHDAQGFLLSLVPIVLRINVHIVNLNTNRDNRGKGKYFHVEKNMSNHPDFMLEWTDNLNFNDAEIFVLRKDGHYDLLVKSGDK